MYVVYLRVALLLVGLMAVPSVAAGITGVSPQEGTVGTQVAVSGSGFGAKMGTVAVGEERCKVLSWSDTRIVCSIAKPMPAGEYAVTVQGQGSKKKSEPMTFSPFTIREPEIMPGTLARDGTTVTIAGAFFGDRKGEVVIAYRDNGVVVDKAKVVGWSMDAVRIRLPAGLAGKYIVKVQNKIGTDFALLDLGDGPPQMAGMAWLSGYG